MTVAQRQPGRGGPTATRPNLTFTRRLSPSGAVGPLVVFAGGPLLLLILAFIHLTLGQADVSVGDVIRAIFDPQGRGSDNIVRYVRMPRLAIGIVAGGALGVAGVLLQSITRNPLASPSTLGISSGAYLALVVSTVFFPGLLGLSPVAIAFSGGTAAAILAYAIAGGVRTTPVKLALAGVAVALVCAALTGALQLLYENETAGLFFWGSGSLAENGWDGTQYAWPRILAGVVVALFLARALDVLALGDDVAHSLGQRVRLIRSVGLLTGVFLAAVAVSVVGPIGFVGLIIPHLVRLMGLSSHRAIMIGTAIWAAAFLIGADVASRVIAGDISEVPAGGVTALIGAPFFVWLARRVDTSRASGQPPARRRMLRLTSDRHPPFGLVVAGAVLLLCATIVAGVAIGDLRFSAATTIETLTGGGTALSQKIILDLRLPRVLVAALAGAALAVSGTLLQGVVRNPLAGPEIVGVTSGAGLFALIVLVLFPGVSLGLVPLAAFVGACVAFAIVYAASWRGGITPTRLALVGIAVSAFCAAGINLLVVEAGLRVAQALVWISGSTYARSWDDLRTILPWVVVLFPVAWVVARQLDFLAIGDDSARGLGVAIERVRVISMATGVGLAAIAVSVVGTIGFVGLIGPHTARLVLGEQQRHRNLVIGAALFGAILLVIADTVGRAALAPKEIPSGLVTAVIGAPYFLWLLWRNRSV